MVDEFTTSQVPVPFMLFSNSTILPRAALVLLMVMTTASHTATCAAYRVAPTLAIDDNVALSSRRCAAARYLYHDLIKVGIYIYICLFAC